MAFPPIAIVGRACVLPGALSPEELWRAVRDGRDLLRPVPAGRWGLPREAVVGVPGEADRAWSDRGGYVEGFAERFDPHGFAIPAAEIAPLDPLVHWVLHTARAALADAGGPVDPARTGAIFGLLSFPTAGLARFAESVWLGAGDCPVDPRDRFMSGYPALLLKRALGLGGAAFTLDAACASSLYALKLACDRLHDGRADAMLAGAVCCADDLFIHIGFSALQALSRSGRSRPFHRDADGLVPAEGCGFVVLRRLPDALRAGERVLAVIRGVGLANDGRGRGFLAPSSEGQLRALRRAYRVAELDPTTVSLLECHATGTAVGDATEVESCAALFAGARDLAIGSLKSNLGHLISAAGVASLIKVVEAMRAGERPPTLHAEEPTPALTGTPLRLLHELEPWPESPRRAGISAFGFGGNNAHLIAEEWRGEGADSAAAPPPSGPIAIIGLGGSLGDRTGRAEVTAALLDGAPVAPAASSVELGLQGLRFPPHDLERTLAQQLALLAAAREAAAEAGDLPRETTGVLVGMGADPEVARWGARWRLSARHPDADEAWLRQGRDAIVPALDASAVVGTMPNVVANRVSSQLDLGGPGFTLSAEEGSGLVALDLAARALRAGELDAALVGAVDLCCEPVHTAAAASVLPAERQRPGDAAVFLVLRRLEDALRRGNRVYAVLDEVERPELCLGLAAGATSLVPRLGHAHAAAGLVHAAAAAVALHHRARMDGAPWVAASRRSVAVRVTDMGGQTLEVALAEERSSPPRPETRYPRLHLFSGADAGEVLANLSAGRKSDGGPARLVVVAADAEELAARAAQARAHLERGAPTGEGVHFRPAPVGGELAFLFAGAAAAYHGMGRELLRALPELGNALAVRFAGFPEALGWAFAEPGPGPSVLDRLWGASSLCQLHAELTLGWLGMRPAATLGYSSGESNALFAVGAWSDLDAMVEASRSSGLFTTELDGPLRAVSAAWGAPAAWAAWTVLAARSEVEAAVAVEARVHLAAVNAPGDCVIAGDEAACARVVQRLGRERAQRLGYELAVHVPELEAVRDEWLALHRRAVTPVPGVRLYSNAANGPVPPESEAWAQAILAQATHTLDFPATVEQAWADGVRVFVEHGPQAACSRWVRAILGERDAVVVALDRPGRGLRQLLEALAELVAAGVPVNLGRLAARLEPAPAYRPQPALRFPAHPPPVTLPPMAVASDLGAPQVMNPAPPLPSVLAEAAAPARAVAPPAAEATAASSLRAYLAQVAGAHREFLDRQAALHHQFLALRQHAMEALLRGAAAGALPTAGAIPGAPPPAESPRPPVSAPPAAAAPGARCQRFDRRQLEVHAAGRISELFGPAFADQDGFARQVRMPSPPLLLADRVTGLDAESGSLGLGTIWTETDVERGAWYLHDGVMPAGLLIEAGQADLMLISYLGIDRLNQGQRVYRLLGCELTYHGDLPRPGDTLAYRIEVDGHASQGPVRLFFFHYDCTVGGEPRLAVRHGQAGFFTDEELAGSAGVLWSPESATPVDRPRLDPPLVARPPRRLAREQVERWAAGDGFGCFGAGYDLLATHTRTPRIQGDRLLLLGEVDELDPAGGPWRRGYLRASTGVRPDDWYFAGHFKNDPCMPGTLMFEGCLQAMAVYLAGLGHTLTRDGWRFQPVPGAPFELKCRGQVAPSSGRITYEVFVEEVVAAPQPTLWADLLCTVDGLKVFHARRVGLQLVPGWPLDTRPELLADHVEAGPAATLDGLPLGYASLLACAWGRPSDAFGPLYRIFDGPRRLARLPGPPYHFMSRVTRVEGPAAVARVGAVVEVDYDVPAEAWYFAANGAPTMPFCVLLEVGLQPCGWLAIYIGSVLDAEEDLSFRNLDGTGTLNAEVPPAGGSVSTRVQLTRVARNAGTVIVSFAVTCRVAGQPAWTMETTFGFFPAAALANQVGLPTDDEQRRQLEAPGNVRIDLCQRPERFFAGPLRLAEPLLLMLDRVTGLWPDGGPHGLGRLRAEKDVDPAEWSFKAHFFQDPVQPGSLGLEAMVQLLQLYMLEREMHEGVARPRFEPLAVGVPLTWKYRGQVLPTNRTVTVTMDIVGVGRDERGPFAVAAASLWVDGKRIYEASNLGMRVVSSPVPVPVAVPEARPEPGPQPVTTWTLDPAVDTWLLDHRPTWSVPAAPMMWMVEALAEAARGTVTGLRDVRVRRWLTVDRTRRLRAERAGDAVRLLEVGENAVEEEVAVGTVLTGEYLPAPPPLPPLAGEPAPDPYTAGDLFHGPALQVLRSLVVGAAGSSSLLDAGGGALPTGRLNPALLDGATHGIPHDRLHLWSAEIPEDRVAYPALIPRLDLHGPTPTRGEVRCEVRFAGLRGSPDLPQLHVQLIHAGTVWADLELVEACFPKGPLGSAPPALRRAFLRDRQPVPGLSLAVHGAGETVLDPAAVERSDWLPGTVAAVYGTRDPELIAVKEHLAAEHGLHPGVLPEALPLTRSSYSVQRHDSRIVVRRTGPATLDIAPVRRFWSDWFARGRWPVEDLYYGLIERFVSRVVLADPSTFAALRGRSLLYLGNHQVGVESLLFSILASGLSRVPTVTLAKAEHRTSWLGRLIRLCFAYPGVSDPEVIAFFDRDDKASLPAIIDRLAGEMLTPGKSVMVHVEGTRSLTCRRPVERMSGAFLDMALRVGAPIVPVRFVGGLPVEPLARRLEFPTGLGTQAVWLGRPILPAELAPLPYAERKRRVIDAINGLGPSCTTEEPSPPDPELERSVQEWVERTGASSEHATLLRVLQGVVDPCPETTRLVAALSANRLELGSDPGDRWLGELARRLFGPRGPRVVELP